MIIFTNDTYLKKNSIKKRTKNQLLTLFGTSITHLRCIQVLSWIMRWSPPICRDNPWTNERTDERSDIMSCLSHQKYYPKFFFRDHFISMKKEHIDWKCHWYHENREFQLTHKDRDYNESMLLFTIYIKSMMKVCYYLP